MRGLTIVLGVAAGVLALRRQRDMPDLYGQLITAGDRLLTASGMGPDPTQRSGEHDRHEAILTAARAELAARGWHATSMHAVARRAGVPQPEVFRSFPTRQVLVLAVLERCFDDIEARLRGAVGGVGSDDPVRAIRVLGQAYHALLDEPELLLVQVHGYAAAQDEDVRAVLQRRLRGLIGFVERSSGAHEGLVDTLLAYAMLLNVAAITDLPEIPARLPWARS